MTLSHRFDRLFNLRALHPPRGFMPIDKDTICVEIGAGKGKHALSFAANNPQTTLYAIERTTHKYAAFAKVAQSLSLPNLHPIHADAISWLRFAVLPKQIATCFILYPNPEPHNKNQRFVNMPFFEFLLSRMQDQGQIILASNVNSYIHETTQMLDEVWLLPYCVRQIESTSARTHFEMKYLARHEICQELIITKPSHYCTRFD